MVRQVTSWFIDQAESHTSEPVRKFYIGNSDYSDYVHRWPSFSRTWDSVRPTNLTVNLSNEDKTFNFFISDRINLVNSCSIQLGYTHITSGDELIDFYNGMITKVSYGNGTAKISIEDKFKPLSEKLIGTQDTPIDYTGSNHLPSDLAWYICTSHGGLDATQSSANTDIDYDSFQTWAAIFSSDAVYLEGRFTGQKCTDALRRISRVTRSSINIKANKIAFQRFSLVDSLSTVITEDSNLGITLDLDDKSIINKQHMLFNYDTTSKYHSNSLIHINTMSVNSYGAHEEVEKDNKVWYVDSPSANNAAQRTVLTKGLPYNSLEVITAANGIVSEIGDMIQLTESHLDISAETYRIMSSKYNLDTLKCSFKIDASQLNNAFVLNTSSLNGSDILS